MRIFAYHLIHFSVFPLVACLSLSLSHHKVYIFTYPKVLISLLYPGPPFDAEYNVLPQNPSARVTNLRTFTVQLIVCH